MLSRTGHVDTNVASSPGMEQLWTNNSCTQSVILLMIDGRLVLLSEISTWGLFRCGFGAHRQGIEY
jgi:hypothetical protein